MPVTSPVRCRLMVVFIVTVLAFASQESHLDYKNVIPFVCSTQEIGAPSILFRNLVLCDRETDKVQYEVFQRS